MERLASLKELMAIDSDRLDELEHSLTTFEVGTYDTTILRYYLPDRLSCHHRVPTRAAALGHSTHS